MKYHPKLILLALFGALALNAVHATLAGAIDPASSVSLVLGQTNPPKPIVGNARAVIYFCIIFGGLLGGLIYSISRNRGFVIPKRYSFKDGDNEFFKFGLGTFADMLVGLGGGILIFLLVPYADDGDLITTLTKSMGTETEASSLLKVIALALIGGFAGISLFDEAAKRITRQIEEVDEIARGNSKQIKGMETAATREAEIQFLLSPLLDPTISPLDPRQEQELTQAIIAAPINVRNRVFSQAQSSLDNYWLMGQKGEQFSETDVETYCKLFQQLVLPFDALVQAARKEQRETGNLDGYLHRYFAHIAFCQQQVATANEILGQVGEANGYWRLAENNLSEAIKTRDDIGDPNHLFWHYDLYLILSHYKLGDSVRAAEELKRIKPVWFEKERGVLASLLKNLNSTFLQWMQSQDASLISADLVPDLSELPALPSWRDEPRPTSIGADRRNGGARGLGLNNSAPPPQRDDAPTARGSEDGDSHFEDHP